MSVAFEPQNSENLYVFCVPIEWLNPIQGRPNIDQPMAVSTYIRNQVNGFFMEELLTKINSKWFYTRCAFNLDTNRMYLNDAPEYELKVPQIFDGQTNFPFQFKKFYKAEDFTDFVFEGISGLKTYLFIRNINLYYQPALTLGVYKKTTFWGVAVMRYLLTIWLMQEQQLRVGVLRVG